MVASASEIVAAAHVLDLELDFMLVLNGCKSSTLLIEGCVCVCANPVAKGASVKSCYR